MLYFLLEGLSFKISKAFQIGTIEFALKGVTLMAIMLIGWAGNGACGVCSNLREVSSKS